MVVLSDEVKAKWQFGSTVPYAEPALGPWLSQPNLMPHTMEWEASQMLPNYLYKKAAEDGVVMPMAAGSEIPREWRGTYPIIGNVAPEEWNGFHDLIIHDEFGRVGGIGIENGLVGGMSLAVPALQKYGSQNIKDTVIPEILSGRSKVALAITEPGAGSDVKRAQTEAGVSDDGSHFVVDGEKKWITSSMYSDYFVTLVKETTGEYTLLVVQRTEGLTTKHITLSGSTAADTAFVDFDNVKVPMDIVVGQRGQGFKYIMSNFNHEISNSMLSFRLSDVQGHAMNRETFGKKLIDHPVIRLKMANMSRETEALQSWVESVIFQLSKLTSEEGVLLLAGTTARLKAHSGIVLETVAREAIQIMGGIGLTRGGRGERVERIWRDVKAIVIPGGSEEIILDLEFRWAVKISEILTAEANGGNSKL
ncbi:hypothetical protein CEP54_015989 [Fusarium duplospermum]|uniref:Acyl-CoA dehydrogenase n=1 Tax=Fusarium duplospermum TaxID=1325734 RepID=A0A428NJK6_9HYPO|nr:hypothetical protein CEP54_015989 [Fusarium duplospermum]